jgi:putative OPT family oligopeptide transporter
MAIAEPVEKTPEFKPYVSAGESPPEFTLRAVVTGAVLGIIFGASSLYLLLKVGMTVSASVPIAVLSITLFRVLAKSFGLRRATILENNIVQTTGSAGESIAFGVGVTMPALLLIGFEMEVTRVMTVSILGGLLGILMMIPLRRAFIVKQHGKLIYPEGTACAEVLVAGEKGGMTAKMVFVGFGIALVHKFLTAGTKLWASEPDNPLYKVAEGGAKSGLKGAAISGELAPELLGVGYLIGPRIAALMMAGAVLSYWVIGPTIATFGEKLNEPVVSAVSTVDPKTNVDKGVIRNMGPGEIKAFYLRYIGAGAVAAGGIISMFRALPLIIASMVSGLRDLRATAGGATTKRTDRDMPMSVVVFGSLALVAALMLVPSLGLGITFQGAVGALMILVFGFLFVTVSSRLTGEVGSSSNPISGMTIATILMVCLIFLVLGRTGPDAMLLALMVSAVVCIASSNGGTTSQDLKTGFLVGATPREQQWSIAVGALTSAAVIGVTMLLLNSAGTHYTNQNLPKVKLNAPADAPRERAGRPHEDDPTEYRVVFVRKNQYAGVKPGRYLVDENGQPVYRTDLPIQREATLMDNGEKAPKPISAPQPQLFSGIIEGILGGELEWGLVVIGVLIAMSLELAGVPALPFAVGMYIPLGSTTPIFIGGILRYITDRARGKSASDTETETSPGVLLSSGYIAGGTLCGLILAFFAFLPDSFNKALDISRHFVPEGEDFTETDTAKLIAVAVFVLLCAMLLWVGTRKSKPTEAPAEESGPALDASHDGG